MSSIAYLCECFPQANQTYVQRELAEVVRQGVTVMPCSLLVSSDPVSDVSLSWDSVWECDQHTAEFDFAMERGKHPGAWEVCRACGDGADLRWSRALKCVEAWRDAGVRHVHAHFGLEAASVACVARLLGGPTYSFTAHGPDEFDNPVGIGLKEKVLHASFVSAISHFTSGQVKRWVPHTEWDKICVVGCSVPELFFEHQQVVSQSSRGLVTIGRLVEQKGQLLMLEGFARAVHEYGTDAELVFVGDGPLRGVLEDSCSELGIREHVRFAGWLDDNGVRKELLASRAMVLPSFAEGLPLAIMESFAIGRPVLSTYLAGIPELVKSGENGWLVAAGDIDGIAHAMDTILRTDVRVLDLFAERGRRAVLERHYTPIVTTRLVTRFRALCEDAHGASEGIEGAIEIVVQGQRLGSSQA